MIPPYVPKLKWDGDIAHFDLEDIPLEPDDPDYEEG